MVGHYVKKCKHGRVVEQCRCIGTKTVQIVDCPPTCHREPSDPNDELSECHAAIDAIRQLALAYSRQPAVTMTGRTYRAVAADLRRIVGDPPE